MPRILVPLYDLPFLAPAFAEHGWLAVTTAPADAQLLRWENYPARAIPDAPAVVLGAPQTCFNERDAFVADATVEEILDLLESPIVSLNEDERIVARFLADGEPVPAIALRLGVSPEEVRRIARRVYRHFGVTRHADFLVEHRRRSSRPPPAM